MIPAASFLDTLRQDADRAGGAEDAYRREAAARIQALELERAFAHRRLNFMRAVAEAVAAAENEAVAVAAAKSVMRARLGWSNDSEARTEALERFAPVAQQAFRGLAPVENEPASPPDVLGALSDFEIWYGRTHPGPFWALFEQYMPETPLVDF